MRKENKELKEKLAKQEKTTGITLDDSPSKLEYTLDLEVKIIDLKQTLAQRDLEIEALKHMLDRKGEEQ